MWEKFKKDFGYANPPEDLKKLFNATMAHFFVNNKETQTFFNNSTTVLNDT